MSDKCVLTIHELWEIYSEIAFLRIAIGQDAIVRQRPSKGIRNNHNDSFWRSIGSFCDVAVQSMQLLNMTSWCAGMEGASGATWFEGHGEDEDGVGREECHRDYRLLMFLIFACDAIECRSMLRS